MNSLLLMIGVVKRSLVEMKKSMENLSLRVISLAVML